MSKRRPKDIGTDDCRAVARAFARNGHPYAEQRNQHGSVDLGDIVGMLSLMVEVKGGAAGRNASDEQIRKWMVEEVIPQTRNASADLGFLVTPRRGIGPANAERWWCHLWLSDLVALGTEATGRATQWMAFPESIQCIVRVHLSDLAAMLRAAGYGDPLEAP